MLSSPITQSMYYSDTLAIVLINGYRSFSLSISQVQHDLVLRFCHLRILRSAAVGVGDIGDDVVGVLEHPFVAAVDGVARRGGSDLLRQQGIGEVLVLVLLAGHVGQHDGIIDLRVLGLQLTQDTPDVGVELALIPHIESPHVVVRDQIHQYFPQFWFDRFRALSVSEECTS